MCPLNPTSIAALKVGKDVTKNLSWKTPWPAAATSFILLLASGLLLADRLDRVGPRLTVALPAFPPRRSAGAAAPLPPATRPVRRRLGADSGRCQLHTRRNRRSSLRPRSSPGRPAGLDDVRPLRPSSAGIRGPRGLSTLRLRLRGGFLHASTKHGDQLLLDVLQSSKEVEGCVIAVVNVGYEKPRSRGSRPQKAPNRPLHRAGERTGAA